MSMRRHVADRSWATSRLKVVLPVAGRPPKTISTHLTMPDEYHAWIREHPSPARVGKLGVVGDSLVVPVVQPALGEYDLAGGVGAAPRLTEDIRGIGNLRVEQRQQPTEFVQAR